MIRWLAGLGRPGSAASRLPARKRNWARSSRHGWTPVRHVRNNLIARWTRGFPADRHMRRQASGGPSVSRSLAVDGLLVIIPFFANCAFLQRGAARREL